MPETWKMIWSMFSPREKRMTLVMAGIAILGAMAQVASVAVIFPFLHMLADPSAREESAFLVRFEAILGPGSDYRFFVALGIFVMAVVLLANAVQILRSYVVTRFTMNRVHGISTRLARSYLSRPYTYFLTRSSSDISKRILAETTEAANSFLVPVADLVSSALSILFILGFLLLVEPWVTLVGLCVIGGLYGGIYIVASRILKRFGEKRIAANRRRFAAVSETFEGIKDVKVAGKEDVFFRRFAAASREFIDAAIINKLFAEIPRFLVHTVFLGAIVLSCILVMSPEDMASQAMSSMSSVLPTLGVFALAGQKLLPEINRAYGAFAKMCYGGAAVRNIHEEMDRSAAFRASLRPIAPMSMREGLALENVCFRYPEARATSLQDMSFSVRAGERIGIVGGTGAGKTTLVDILMGLIEPSSGRVLVDGTPVETPGDRAAWRAAIGYVPQSIFLLDGSFRNNIAFGEAPSKIDPARVEAAARAAAIHDVIMETELGYDTQIGDRGVMLSGGQRQRLGIARALYRGAGLLVLDEATSALDGETEKVVIDAIEGLSRETTVIMIAHRLSTLETCDRILVLDRGKLVQDGPWQVLATSEGPFRRLLKAGSDGRREEG